jgi:hypothetical protein
MRLQDFLNPIEDQLEALQIAENMIVNEEISLQAACDWLEYKTDRKNFYSRFKETHR